MPNQHAPRAACVPLTTLNGLACHVSGDDGGHAQAGGAASGAVRGADARARRGYAQAAELRRRGVLHQVGVKNVNACPDPFLQAQLQMRGPL